MLIELSHRSVDASVVNTFVKTMREAAIASGSALDENEIQIVRDNLFDLVKLLWAREVMVVMMRADASDEDLEAVISDLCPSPAPHSAPVIEGLTPVTRRKVRKS